MHLLYSLGTALVVGGLSLGTSFLVAKVFDVIEEHSRRKQNSLDRHGGVPTGQVLQSRPPPVSRVGDASRGA
jgi:hypothetical protein